MKRRQQGWNDKTIRKGKHSFYFLMYVCTLLFLCSRTLSLFHFICSRFVCSLFFFFRLFSISSPLFKFVLTCSHVPFCFLSLFTHVLFRFRFVTYPVLCNSFFVFDWLLTVFSFRSSQCSLFLSLSSLSSVRSCLFVDSLASWFYLYFAFF